MACGCPNAIVQRGPWGSDNLPRFRYPDQTGSFSASKKGITIGSDGWIEFAGSHSGWTVTYDPNLPAIAINAGDMFPCPPNGRFDLTAGTGTVVLRHWDEDTGMILAQGARQSALRTVSPKFAPISTISLGALVLAAAGTAIANSPKGTALIDTTAGPVLVRVVPDGAGAAPVAAFLAETQTKAALLGAAGGGTPVYAAGEKEWYVPQAGQLWGASAGGADTVYVDQST